MIGQVVEKTAVGKRLRIGGSWGEIDDPELLRILEIRAEPIEVQCVETGWRLQMNQQWQQVQGLLIPFLPIAREPAEQIPVCKQAHGPRIAQQRNVLLATCPLPHQPEQMVVQRL